MECINNLCDHNIPYKMYNNAHLLFYIYKLLLDVVRGNIVSTALEDTTILKYIDNCHRNFVLLKLSYRIKIFRKVLS